MKTLKIFLICLLPILLLGAASPLYVEKNRGTGTNNVLQNPTVTGNQTNIATTAVPTFMTIRPPDGNESNLFYFGAMAAANTGNASRSNAGFAFGHNFNGGGRVISGEPAFGWVFESHYEPTTNLPQYETYFQFYATNGNSMRPLSYVVGKTGGGNGSTLVFSANAIWFAASNSGNVYFTMQPLAVGGQVRNDGVILAYQSSSSGGLGLQMADGAALRFQDSSFAVDMDEQGTNFVINKAFGLGDIIFSGSNLRKVTILSSVEISGNTTVTQALAFGVSTVSLTADNQSVSATNISYISISSNDGTAGNRTFVLSAGTITGQTLKLEWTGTNAGELVDDFSATGGGNGRLSATWTPTQYDSITLHWNGTDWIEDGRSTN